MSATGSMTTPSWEAAQGWLTPPHEIPTWASVERWTQALEQIGAEDRATLLELRTELDHALADLGGDPTRIDWSRFRPLRRHREEDWSDWLAQLIADSEHSELAWRLFGARERRPRTSYRAREVHRELTVEDRRADLIIEWVDGCYTHVEVKVGDPHLEKTPDTARKVRQAMRHCAQGADFLLVLPEQESAWTALRADLEPDWDRVHLLTWASVSRALRAALVHSRFEPVRWRVWAHALCGAIDTELLGLPSAASADEWCRRLTPLGLATALQLLRPATDGVTDVERRHP